MSQSLEVLRLKGEMRRALERIYRKDLEQRTPAEIEVSEILERALKRKQP